MATIQVLLGLLLGSLLSLLFHCGGLSVKGFRSRSLRRGGFFEGRFRLVAILGDDRGYRVARGPANGGLRSIGGRLDSIGSLLVILCPGIWGQGTFRPGIRACFLHCERYGSRVLVEVGKKRRAEGDAGALLYTPYGLDWDTRSNSYEMQEYFQGSRVCSVHSRQVSEGL